MNDFSLPGLNGLQLLDAIQQRLVIPINAVLVTGDTSPERIELTTSWPWMVLFKPVDLPGFLAAMNAVDVMATVRGYSPASVASAVLPLFGAENFLRRLVEVHRMEQFEGAQAPAQFAECWR
jgi:hypothetical protein